MIDAQETALRIDVQKEASMADVQKMASRSGRSLLGVLRSEWIKLWSLRVSRVAAVFMLVPMTIINLLVLLFADVKGGTQLLAVEATVRMFTTIDLVFIIVLGGMFAAGEFSTGSIRPSLGAVPNRGLLVVAKIAVVAVAVLILSGLAVGISVALGLIVLPMRGVEQSLASPAIRMIVGLCLYSMLMGLFSFCIGFLGRSSVGAISVTLGILWILPSVVKMLGDGEAAQAIMARLPGVAGSQAFALEPAAATGGAWGGLAILAANVVVMSVIAVNQFRRLDV